MRVLLAAAAAVMVMVSGCSVDVPASAAADRAMPFDQVLLELFGTTDVEAYLSANERAASELVAECMQAAGFDFNLPAAASTGPSQEEAETLEFAQTEGFGLVTNFRRSIESASMPAGDIDELNRAYLQTLTAAEIDAFFMTLDGKPAEPGQLQTEPGCRGQANDQAFAEWARFFDALPQYTAMGEERDTHPDWLVARDGWHACMIEKGYDYDDPDEIRSDVAGRMETLMTGESGQLVVETSDGATLGPEVEALFDEMLEFERGAAVANFECNESLADAFNAVEHEVQQGFVERNQAVIDQLLAD